MKVVLLDSQIIKGYDYSVEQAIIEQAGFTFVKESCTNEDEVIAKCKDADAILNITIRMSEKSISQLENCRVMVRYGIGVDEFDIPAATAKGIKVCNVTTYCLDEVAHHTTALLMALARNLKHFDAAVHRGVWNQDLGPMMRRSSSQTVGLIGFGNISKRIAKKLQGVGYNVVAYDPYVSAEVFAENGVKQLTLDELYAAADMISLHLPQTEETFHMINKDTIGKMKEGVLLINCSRGGLINTEDLVAALDSGKVGGAGLDVMEAEPMKDTNHPLLNRNNVIVTPHLAYRSQESNTELFQQVAETVVGCLKGEDLPNILNKKALA